MRTLERKKACLDEIMGSSTRVIEIRKEDDRLSSHLTRAQPL